MAQEIITLKDGTTVQVADFEYGFVLEGKADQDVIVENDGKLIIEGYASDYDVDRDDEAFESGAFQAGLKAYMDNPVILYHHKRDTALGQVKEARIDQKGLWVKAEIDEPEPGTTTADLVRKIRSRTLRGFSVGGKFYRRIVNGVPKIFKCDLREISITPQPVNKRMLFSIAGKAFDSMDDMPQEVVKEPEDTKAIEEALERIDAYLNAAEQQHEGKASQHPDGPKIAALLYHMQKVHTLATNTKQDAESEDVKNRAGEIADHVKKHVSSLHKLAAKHGPLPDYYGPSYL